MDLSRFTRKSHGHDLRLWTMLGAGVVVGALGLIAVQSFGKAERRASARLRARRSTKRLGQPASREHVRTRSHPAGNEPL